MKTMRVKRTHGPGALQRASPGSGKPAAILGGEDSVAGGVQSRHHSPACRAAQPHPVSSCDRLVYTIRGQKRPLRRVSLRG